MLPPITDEVTDEVHPVEKTGELELLPNPNSEIIAPEDPASAEELQRLPSPDLEHLPPTDQGVMVGENLG